MQKQMQQQKKTENDRPYSAPEYDTFITKTLPYSRDFYDQVLSMLETFGKPAGKLLDAGCGAGMFEYLLRQKFPEMDVLAIDPAEDMLTQAISRNIDGVLYRSGTVLDLNENEHFDMITAIMSHHFVRPEHKKDTIDRIFRALNADGIYIAFENVLPEEDPEDTFLREKELDRWMNYQIASGKSPEEAYIHRKRCGVFYFPLTVQEHIDLLKEVGFRCVYVFWRSYMQMGIMGIK